MSSRSAIIEEMTKVASEQNRRLAPMTDETILADSGLDSLCFAILVARLEDRLGRDPFTEFSDAAFPVTFQNLVTLYDAPAR